MHDRTIQYLYANLKRSPSRIIESDASECTPLSELPSAGYTAYTRFFAPSEKVQPRFVVKQPKLDRVKEKELEAAISCYVKEYKKEQEIWNSVYPNQRAELIAEGAVIRLILPYFPGEPACAGPNDDQLTLCKKTLAAIYAVQKFHQLGWSHNDCSMDNFLIEKKPNGNFEAYLIDFGSVSKRDDFISNSEWGVISGLARCVSSLYDLGYKDVHVENVDSVIAHLLSEIDRLEKSNQLQKDQNSPSATF